MPTISFSRANDIATKVIGKKYDSEITKMGEKLSKFWRETYETLIPDAIKKISNDPVLRHYLTFITRVSLHQKVGNSWFYVHFDKPVVQCEHINDILDAMPAEKVAILLDMNTGIQSLTEQRKKEIDILTQALITLKTDKRILDNLPELKDYFELKSYPVPAINLEKIKALIQ